MRRDKLENQCFGYWKVLSYAGCYEHKKSYYYCQCMKCNGIYKVRADKMKSGGSTQCFACARKSQIKNK